MMQNINISSFVFKLYVVRTLLRRVFCELLIVVVDGWDSHWDGIFEVVRIASSRLVLY